MLFPICISFFFSHLYFFSSVSVKVFGPFVNQVFFYFLSFNHSLYILSNSSFFRCTVSQPVGLFFVFFLILLILPFAEQIYIYLILVKSSLLIISFTDYAFKVVSKKSLSQSRSSSFSPFYFLGVL